MYKSGQIAAILVGGKGTRLRSLISDVPKPLAPVGGEPFLFLILRQLASVGIKRVVLLTGYLHEKVVAACQDGQQFGLEILYSQEHEPLGTAGAILQARPFLEDYPDFILMNGDTILDCSLDAFLRFPMVPNWMGLIGAMQPKETARFGSLDLDPETQTINAFREKDQHSTGIVNAGIYRLSKSIFDMIPAGQFCSLETDIFPSIIKNKMGLRAFLLNGEFVDIGVPESYLAFNKKIES